MQELWAANDPFLLYFSEDYAIMNILSFGVLAMAKSNQDWDSLGRDIQRIVDQAVRSQDYQKLNQTIHQVIDRAVDAGSDAIKRAVDSTTRPAQRPVQQARPVVIDSETGIPENRNLPMLYGSTGGKTAGGILKVVGGGILTLSTFAGTVASLVFSLVTGMALLNVRNIFLGLGLLGGVCLLTSGIRTLTWVGRFKTYCKALGRQTHMSLERLARTVGRKTRFVRKELEQMIDAGLFLEGHIDKEEKTLITSNETYRQYEQSRLALEERQRQQEAMAKAQEQAAQAQKAARDAFDPQVQEVLDKGNAFLAEIRKCNDDIPGQEISDKISRMELIVQRIFQRAEAHPEIVPDLKKMMDYYLPMTVKLLRAYADMDAQPVQGQTIQASKKEIEDTLDTLNQAFENLLDSVFKDTAMDVSSDISVLQTLLARDGLTEDDLTKMKNSQR